MKLFVLIGHRHEAYEGQNGFEALACMSEYDNDENPEYMPQQLGEHEASKEFAALRIVTFEVNGNAIHKILYPESAPLAAKIV